MPNNVATYELSIVVPFYKNTDDVDILLESVSKFLGKVKNPVEVILINDSGDSSFINIIESYQFDVIVINLDKNIGVTGARNIGYKKANSDLVLFLDSDDLLLPNSFSEMNSFTKSINADVYFFRCINVNGYLVGEPQDIIVSSYSPNKMYGKGERIICIRKNKFLPFIEFLRGCENAGLLYFALKSKKIKFSWSPLPIRIYKSNENGLSSKINSVSRSFSIAIGHFLSSIFSIFFLEFSWSIRFLISSVYRFVLTIIFLSNKLFQLK